MREQGEYPMASAAFIILGLLAGVTAIRVFNGTGAGVIEEITVGIFGAVVTGTLYDAFTAPVSSGFNVDGLLVATLGSAVLLVTHHAVFRRDTRYRSQSGGRIFAATSNVSRFSHSSRAAMRTESVRSRLPESAPPNS